MKNLYAFTVLLIALLCGSLQAQNYTTSACPQYSLNSCGAGNLLISNGTFAISGDDQISGAIALPFSFNFYGSTYSSVYVSSNGFITFNGGGSACCSGYVLPNSNSTAYIALAHSDLYAYSGTPGTNGSVYYSTVGTAPYRTFVVRYQNVDQCCGNTARLDGEIQLFETTNEIRLVTSFANVQYTVTQGIAKGDNSTAMVVSGRNAVSPFTLGSECWSFLPAQMEISNGTFAISGDDQISGAIPLPFNFNFDGTSYSSVYVSSNGFITFNGGGSACCSGYSLPGTNNTAYIALAHTDLYSYSSTPGTAGSIYYATVGIAPNRIFVVHYQDVGTCCSATPQATGEIQLLESTNQIRIVPNSLVLQGRTTTMGIAKGDNATSVVIAGRNANAWDTGPECWLLTPAALPAPSIASFSPTSACPGSTVTITGANFTGATAVSFGGTPAASFNVVSATQITAVLGAGSSGSVSVTTPGGSASLGGFTFTSGVTANAGPDVTICQGQSTTLSGSGTGATTYSWSPTTGLSNPNIANPVASPTTTTTYTLTASTGGGGGGQVAYNGAFVQGQSPTTAATDWCTFRGQLLNTLSYNSLTIRGSANPVGITLTDPVAVAGLANALNSSSNFSYTDGSGNVWAVSVGCVSGSSPCPGSSGVVLTVNAQNCNCEGPSPSVYIVRPEINDENWGGINTGGCTSPSQTMEVIFGLAGGGGGGNCVAGTPVSFNWSPTFTDISPSDFNVASQTFPAMNVSGLDLTGMGGSFLHSHGGNVVFDIDIWNGTTWVNVYSQSTTSQINFSGINITFPVVQNATEIRFNSNPPQNQSFHSVFGTFALTPCTLSAGCSATDQVTVTVTPLPTANAGADVSICAGASTTLNGVVTNATNITWSPSTGLSNPNIANPVASPSTTTTYTLTASAGAPQGCTPGAPVSLSWNPTSTDAAPSDFNVASQTFPAMNVSGLDLSGMGGSFLHSHGGTVEMVIELWDGTQWVNVFSQTTTSQINFNGIVLTFPPVQNVTEIRFNSNPPQFQSYHSVGGTFTLTPCTLSPGCSASDEVVVTVNPVPGANAGPDVAICEGQSTTLQGSGANAATFTWSPTTGLSNPNIANPIASPTTTTTYTLTTTSGGGGGAAGRVYMRSQNCQPWGQTTNEAELDAVFGGGNWQDLRFETSSPTTVFSAANRFVFLEGSDCGADELNAYLAANLPLIESWVANGGSLLLNAAPNEGGSINFGFGGTTLVYPSFTGTASMVTSHPIFSGPYASGSGPWSGTSFGHATVTGSGMNNLLVETGFVLAEKIWGSGHVLFGGMTTTNWHSPQPQADFLRQNMFYYLDNVAVSGCSATDQVVVTVNPTPVVNAGTDVSICVGQSTTLAGTTSVPGTVTWSPGTGLNSTTILTPVASPASTTTYSLNVTSGAGCSGNDQVNVMVTPLPDAGFTTLNTQYCTTDPNVTLVPNTPGGTFSGTGLTPPDVFSPSTLGPGNYSLTYTISGGGGGAYTYSAIPYNPRPTGGNFVSLGDNQMSSPLPIGFNFDFYGTSYSQFEISSNGFISFNLNTFQQGCCSGGFLPTTFGPSNLIAAAWEDLYPPGGGSITYNTTGTPGSRVLVVSWDVGHYCCSYSNFTVTTQIVLYEGSNVIEIHTTQMNSDGGSHTQGIQDATNTQALTPPGRNSQSWTAFNDGVRFTPSGGACGNSSTQNVAVVNCNVPPVAICQNLAVNADNNCQGTATASQFNNGSFDPLGDPLTFSVAPAAPYALGTTNVVLTVSDGVYTSTCAATITVTDVTPPSITCPQSIVQSNDPGICGSVINHSVQASDNCPGFTVVQTAGLPSGSTFPVGSTSNSFTVTDGAGLTATCSFSVTITDNEEPSLLCGEALLIGGPNNSFANNVTLTNDPGICGAFYEYDNVAEDNCPGVTVSQLAGLPSGSIFPVGATTNTILATDASGNTTTCQFIVTVIDVEPPVARCNNLTLNLDNAGNASTTAAAVNNGSTDNCAIASVTLAPTSFSCANRGNNTAVLTVTDIYGNVGTCAANILVRDLIAPTITCPAPIVVSNTTNLCSAVVSYSVTSADNCAGQTVAQTAGLASGSSFPVGITTNSFTVTDASGNTATCSFTVRVNDTQAPVITCPPSQTVCAINGALSAVVTFANATATDNCPGVGVAQTAGLPSGSSFPVGNTTVTFRATDASGNTATCSFVITVNTFTANSQVFAERIGNTTSNTTVLAHAGVLGFDNDNFTFTGNAEVRTSTPSSGYGGASGLANVFFTNSTTNPAGVRTFQIEGINTTNFSQMFLAFGCQKSTTASNGSEFLIEVSTNGTTYTPITHTPMTTGTGTTAWQTVSAPIVPGSIPSTSNLRIRFTNTSSTVQFRLDDIILVGTTHAATITNVGNTSFCQGGSVTLVSSLATSYMWSNGQTTQSILVTTPGAYSVTVTDANGCQATAGPVNVTVFPNPTVTATGVNPACPGALTGSATASPSGGTPSYTYLWTPGSQTGITATGLGAGSYSVRVTDANGCTATSNLVTLTDNDIVAPVAVCTGFTTQLNSAGQATITAANVDGGSTDNCSIVNRSVTPSAFTCANLGANTVTLTVTDVGGNTASCTATVTVQDNVAPTALCQDLTINLDATGNASITASQANAGSLDNCTVASVVVSPTAYTCSDVQGDVARPFISEYVEGTGNNKAIEIYNPTSVSINLAAQGYMVNTYSNGATTPSSSIALTGTVAPFSTYVLGHGAANLAIQGASNQLTSGGLGWFNGNDAVVLMRGVDTMDVFGKIGCDPGPTWDLGGNQTANRTLVRKSSTRSGVSANPTGACTIASFSSLGSQWIGSAVDVSTNLGSHTFLPRANVATLVVTDQSGNTSACNLGVTVNDVTAPVAVCQNLTVNLDANGAGCVTPSQVDNGSSDACGIASRTLDVSCFACSNVGQVNTVVLTVTDVNNNSSTCSATISVEDHVAPVALCHNLTVQLDNAGFAAINPGMVDAGSSDACGLGDLLINPSTFLCSNVGPNTVTLTVTDLNGNVSTCTSSVTVQDNVAPVAVCRDVTVQLDVNGQGCTTPQAVDNGSSDACGIANLSLDVSCFACSNVGANTVILTATDNNGNQSTCSATVTVEDNVAPVALCRNITVQLDNGGNATITPADINNGSNDACNSLTFTLNDDMFGCVDVFTTNVVTLTATDINGNSSTCTATVTVEDNVLPVAVCQDVTVYLDNMGNGTTTPSAADGGSSDACGKTLTLSQTSFVCSEVGANLEVLTVTDPSGNSSTCSTTITVIDAIAPIARCQNVTVQLDNTGNGSTTAAAVNNNSTDACGIASLSLSQTAFVCSEVGGNTVTLTVTDVNGNHSTCAATVTVQDNVAPVAICQAVTVQLDNTGNGSTTAAAVDNGSNDACGIDSLSLSQTAFACSEVGANAEVLTVTDVNGNASTCSTTVTVEDNVAPVISCPANITVNNQPGFCGSTVTYAATATDACGIAGYAYSPASGSFFSVGTSSVTATATDVNGNSTSCTFTVTVVDNIAPVALCRNLTVQLDNLGNGSITAAQVDNGSTDECGVNNLGVTPADFDCGNVGPNTVVLTVTDNNGNNSTCTATVTVEDNVAPVAVCQDITVQAGSTGTVSIAAQDVDGGSSDACGIASTTINVSTFNCGNAGANAVILTVTDVNGNVSTCTANVTIVAAPIVITLTSPADACGYNVSSCCAVDGSGSGSGSGSHADGSHGSHGSHEARKSGNVGSGHGHGGSSAGNLDHCGEDGVASASVAGGCAPYTYLWSTGATTSSISGLTPGLYIVTVTDGNGTTAVQTIVLTQAAPLGASVSVTNISCYGQQDGSVTAVPTGGCGPYTYLWSYQNATTQTLTGLKNGKYKVTITDHYGCSAEAEGEVTKPTKLRADAGAHKVVYPAYAPQACATLTGSANGGTPAYTAVWKLGNGTVVGTGMSVSVCPTVTTVYHLWVTDSRGCTARDSVAVCPINISCGAGMIQICHNAPGRNGYSTTQCVPTGTVAAHLAHGDKLGACGLKTNCNFPKGSKGSRGSATHAKSDEAQGGESDGQYTLSMRAFPNPSRGLVDVELSCQNCSEDATYQLKVADLTGHVLMVTDIRIERGEGSVRLNLTDLSAGVYMISVNDVVQRIMKQ